MVKKAISADQGIITLVIMAAGLGSRFGEGIKQLAPVGANGEIIMDYSIHDAIKAGFKKIVFVIRHDIESDFNEQIGGRIRALCGRAGVEVCYAYQELDDVPDGFSVPEGRKKPWGTGQAVLCAKEYLAGPFAVINADDYYGKECFVKMHEWLSGDHVSNEIAMGGFLLGNTLSEHGGVTRGVCKECGGAITSIHETSDIRSVSDDVSGEKKIVAGEAVLDPYAFVSMNFWGFPAEKGCAPDFLIHLEAAYRRFFRCDVQEAEKTSEFLLPVLIGSMLETGKISVCPLKTNEKWFGVTYQEDKESVRKNFSELIKNGVYCSALYSDLF